MAGAAKLLTALLLAVALTAQAQSPLEDCVKTFDANKDCFTEKSTTDAAKLFTVEYKNYYKLVSLKPTFGAPSSYALVIRGAPKTNLPTNVNATIEIPLRTVAVTDTTSIPYLELLGKRSAITAMANPEYASSPCFQKLVASGDVKKVDDKVDANAAATYATVDAVFSGVALKAGLADGKVISQAASSDPGAFNRAEHLEYFAQFFGQDGEAQKITTEIQKRYNAIRDAANKAKLANPLKVAWISYSAPSSFNNNTASWSFSAAQYKKDLVVDAGATLVAPAGGSFKDANQFRAALAEVDVAIWEMFASGDAPTMDRFKKDFGVGDDFKVVKNNGVYAIDRRLNPTAFMDWFESALVFPNVVLQDIVSAVNPAAVKGISRTYLRRLDEKVDVLRADQCTGDAKAALSVQGIAAADVKPGDATKPSGTPAATAPQATQGSGAAAKTGPAASLAAAAAALYLMLA